MPETYCSPALVAMEERNKRAGVGLHGSPAFMKGKP